MAVVSVYSGVTAAGHWNDCHPALALAANPSEAIHELLLARIASEEWAILEAACRGLAHPLKCGLFALSNAAAA
jgi:hypothetical protein